MHQKSTTLIIVRINQIKFTRLSLLLEVRTCKKGYSGATSHYITEEDEECLEDVKPYHRPSVILQDGEYGTNATRNTIFIERTVKKVQTATTLPAL